MSDSIKNVLGLSIGFSKGFYVIKCCAEVSLHEPEKNLRFVSVGKVY
jgi:hypothetical protein